MLYRPDVSGNRWVTTSFQLQNPSNPALSVTLEVARIEFAELLIGIYIHQVPRNSLYKLRREQFAVVFRISKMREYRSIIHFPLDCFPPVQMRPPTKGGEIAGLQVELGYINQRDSRPILHCQALLMRVEEFCPV